MAKRMIIVDEKVYHQLVKPWNQTPTDNSKSHLNDRLETQLDTNEPDDVRAKLYQADLSRYLNVNQKQQPTAPLHTLLEPPKKKKAKRARWSTGPKRASTRKHIPWSRFDDNDE